jgi:hypothetical protein
MDRETRLKELIALAEKGEATEVAYFENQWPRGEITLEEQQAQIKALTASLKEQAAQIQQVSARLEVSKSSPRVVTNN